MAKVDQPITVNQVLDARPRIFSLPVAIIVPVMFIVTGAGAGGYILRMNGYMILLTIVVCMSVYFFLFGQQSWKLLAKFRKPYKWVRADVQAVPFTLDRSIYNETKTKRRRRKNTRQQSREASD
ncbi:MAG: hypothetical protein WA947_08420 [Phormidesmis sp.]